MSKHRPGAGRNSIPRLVFVGISLLFQAGWLLLRIKWLNDYSQGIAAVTALLSILAVLRLNSQDKDPAMKMPWIMLILAFPVLGLSMYLLFELLGDPGIGKRLRRIRAEMPRTAPESAQDTLDRLRQSVPEAAGIGRYLYRQGGFPVYGGTGVTYYAQTTDALADLKEALRSARQFIFMEYFIVEDGTVFRELEQILAEKVRQGVEVRLMYDDIGSVGKVSMRFAQRLNSQGIRCVSFNPALPILNLFLNHRDHRKITVVDGRIGFTGGFNLADEYFNLTHPYGIWKDTAIRLEGEAVCGLTATFLELWSVQTRQTEDPQPYTGVIHSVPARGFVQPFGDSPLDPERIAENVYLELIHRARQRLYIMTPYLIITDEMQHALTMAAMAGVDVRIIVPGIPDKRTVYAVTRSYFSSLARRGVRIYSYTPGFCHGKQCLCDDRLASIGTSNLDYRSLYHHFENNVLLTDCEAIHAMAADFEALFPQCRELTQSCRSGEGPLLRAFQSLLRLFAPLL